MLPDVVTLIYNFNHNLLNGLTSGFRERNVSEDSLLADAIIDRSTSSNPFQDAIVAKTSSSGRKTLSRCSGGNEKGVWPNKSVVYSLIYRSTAFRTQARHPISSIQNDFDSAAFKRSQVFLS